MAAFNQVILMGNLTRDPEVRYTPGGDTITSFGLAVNNRYKKADGQVAEEVSFFDIEAWKKTAENCAEYLAKGRPVLIVGRLKQDRWEKDGVKQSRIKVVATNVQFLGAKKDDAAPQGAAPPSGGAPEGAPADDGEVF